MVGVGFELSILITKLKAEFSRKRIAQFQSDPNLVLQVIQFIMFNIVFKSHVVEQMQKKLQEYETQPRTNSFCR